MQRQHEINQLIEWHGLTHVERVLEVHRTTIQRWMKGQVPVPLSAIIALRSLKGDFPHMELNGRKHWEGWSFGRDGTLYEPNGAPHTAAQISATHWQNQLVASLKVRVQELEKMLDAGNIQHRVIMTANDAYEDLNHPQKILHEELYQAKKKKARLRR